jgi:benzoyl-CoA-dihydrodiol lyase
MLGLSTHAWKVNFCKFTNETRNGIEDSSRHSGLKFIAAVNGACAGGGYELALACDEIMLVDDRSSSVALPEVPLLGVLPGTGGLTRLTDKRKVRHDRADIFCTVVEGIRGERAKQWRLVDEVVKPNQFDQAVQARALELAAQSDRPADAKGIRLTRIERSELDEGIKYATLDVSIDRAKRTATFTAKAPAGPQPSTIDAIVEAGASWWPLQFARELDDAILSMRTNELGIGTWIFKTEGEASAVLAADAALLRYRDHWFVRETIGMLRRTLARIDVSSRSLFALIEPGSCFAGTFAELAFAADRSYMAALPANEDEEPAITLSEVNFGLYPMVTQQSRLARRFYEESEAIEAVREKIGVPVHAIEAERLGLVTASPDDIDWADEIRIALEERAAMSPDALTGLEANLRFNGAETMETRIFGRLSAWQNWIFNRPNAVGEKGALKVYGKGSKAQFDIARV